MAEINDPAALATERELSIRTLDGFLANRAAKLEGALAGHNTSLDRKEVFSELVVVPACQSKNDQSINHDSNDPGHEIVIMSLNDLPPVELPGFRFHSVGELIHKDLPINFRRVHLGAALEQKLRFV